MFLESFTHSPFGRVILGFDFNIPMRVPYKIFDCKDDFLSTCSFYFEQSTILLKWHVNLTAVKEGVKFPLKPRHWLFARVYGESRILFKFNVLCDGNTRQILLLAVNAQIQSFAFGFEYIYPVEQVISPWVLSDFHYLRLYARNDAYEQAEGDHQIDAPHEIILYSLKWNYNHLIIQSYYLLTYLQGFSIYAFLLFWDFYIDSIRFKWKQNNIKNKKDILKRITFITEEFT